MAKVLVVDDNRDSAESLAILLTLTGHETRIAYEGEEAIVIAEQFRPDAVLLDIGMPKLDGYETCRRIRREPWGQSIMLIAQTGWGQYEDKRRTEDAGFDAHLVKPVDHVALARLLRTLENS